MVAIDFVNIINIEFNLIRYFIISIFLKFGYFYFCFMNILLKKI